MYVNKPEDAVTTEIPLEAQLRSPSRDTALGTTHHGHSGLKVNITSSPLDITNGPNPGLKTPGEAREAHEAHHWSGDYSSQMQKPAHVSGQFDFQSLYLPGCQWKSPGSGHPVCGMSGPSHSGVPMQLNSREQARSAHTWPAARSGWRFTIKML